MKECINCKTLLEDDELFCHECGTKQEIEEPEAQVGDTQKPEAKKCIHCGESIEADSMFCPFCGKPQEVEEVKNEESQKEVEKEEPNQEEPKEEKPTSQKVEPEVTQEKPTYEEEKSSKKWLWILLTLLVVGAGGWYFYENSSWSDDRVAQEETIDTDSIPLPDEQEEYTEETPASEIGFLNQFYKGEIGDEGYIQQNVTASVLNKLKRDYEYECPSNDCLATWVFTAYPPGADMTLEEGPVITTTGEDERYRADFTYSFYNGNQKGREIRTVFLTVTEVDGKYLISDYEVVLPDGLQNQDEMKEDEEMVEEQPQTIVKQNGHYFIFNNLAEGPMNMHIKFSGNHAQGYYFFCSYPDYKLNVYGEIDDNRILTLKLCGRKGIEYCVIEGLFKDEKYKGTQIFFNPEKENYTFDLNWAHISETP